MPLERAPPDDGRGCSKVPRAAVGLWRTQHLRETHARQTCRRAQEVGVKQSKSAPADARAHGASRHGVGVLHGASGLQLAASGRGCMAARAACMTRRSLSSVTMNEAEERQKLINALREQKVDLSPSCRRQINGHTGPTWSFRSARRSGRRSDLARRVEVAAAPRPTSSEPPSRPCSRSRSRTRRWRTIWTRRRRSWPRRPRPRRPACRVSSHSSTYGSRPCSRAAIWVIWAAVAG